jgi:hypothetical protein
VLLVDPPGAAQAVERKMTASSMSMDERREVLFALCAFMTVLFPGVLGAEITSQHNP